MADAKHMPKTKRMLPTWAGRSKFHYDGSVLEGTTIYAGRKIRKYEVAADDYAAIRKRFAGQEVCIGTDRIDPPRNSVGAWLQKEGRSYGMMSYLGPILIEEGYAVRCAASDRIRFKSN